MATTQKRNLNALVLSFNEFREYDKFINILSETEGINRYLAKSVRKTGAKMNTLLCPWKFIRIDIVQGKNFDIITGASLIRSFSRINQDSQKIWAAHLISGLITQSSADGFGSSNLYQWTLKTFENLNDNPYSHVRSLININQLITLTGYNLHFNMDQTSKTKVIHDNSKFIFNYQDSSIKEYNRLPYSQNETIIPGKLLNLLLKIPKMSDNTFHNIHISYNMFIRIATLYLNFFRWHTGLRYKPDRLLNKKYFINY